MTVRESKTGDLPAMLDIYEKARKRMHEGGNPTQWVNYPTKAVLENDLLLHRSYVIEEDGGVCGTFVFTIGEDPTYKVIEGAWLDETPYGVIHRIAGDGVQKGILHTALTFATAKIKNIRIDTHENNLPMRKALAKEGFTYCGVIYIRDDVSDHSPRIAFQKKYL